jgi:3-carboxy-cis,cis-muconate cycloisomerase
MENTNGAIFAERAMMLLGAKLGRDAAHKVLEMAVRKSVKEGRHLAAVLAEAPEVTAHLSRAELNDLEMPEQYLGSAEAFRKALAAESDRDDDDPRDADRRNDDKEQ